MVRPGTGRDDRPRRGPATVVPRAASRCRTPAPGSVGRRDDAPRFRGRLLASAAGRRARATGDPADGRPAGQRLRRPPPTTAPPPGWRPPLHLLPPPPRRLPGQDADALDAAEQRAQRVTQVVGAVVGVVLLVVICLLCSRVLS
ncbi:hypothetical protein [Micromonospora sagamiensis]|uniref:hypothetical protein n=1 Tax=Micromonospora sagamiensis TaxID=47875 RepID=UPI003CC8283B